MSVSREMPKYRCHKEVWALKISALEIREDGSAKITPDDPGYGVVEARPEWLIRFDGDENDLGYYVVYSDGFAYWSPSKAFESGYTRIN